MRTVTWIPIRSHSSIETDLPTASEMQRSGSKRTEKHPMAVVAAQLRICRQIIVTGTRFRNQMVVTPHVETVVLLSREKVDGHIDINLDVEEE